jgi:hypothetical protein
MALLFVHLLLAEDQLRSHSRDVKYVIPDSLQARNLYHLLLNYLQFYLSGGSQKVHMESLLRTSSQKLFWIIYCPHCYCTFYWCIFFITYLKNVTFQDAMRELRIANLPAAAQEGQLKIIGRAIGKIATSWRYDTKYAVRTSSVL